MDFSSLMDSFVVKWILIPLLIIISRICDVTLQTLRVILLSKGNKFLPPITSFFEVLLWILVAGQVLRNIDNPIYYVAYAGGFSLGTFAGIMLEKRIRIGRVIVQVITDKDSLGLIQNLKQKNYGVTLIPGYGATGPVNIIFTIIKKQYLQDVLKTIEVTHPNAFYTINDIKDVSENGIFPIEDKKGLFGYLTSIHRKGK